MLAHCSLAMERAMGKLCTPRILAWRTAGGVGNAITEKSCLVTDERDFVVERQRLRESIDRFATGGPGVCTKHPRFFFGPLTPVEWAALMYQHLDHHLRQFGV